MFVRNVVSSVWMPGRRNRGEVNDGVDAREGLDGLAEVGQVGE